MLKYIPFYIFSFIIILYSCSSSHKTENELPVFNPGKVEFTEISLSDIADEISYIQFDTTVLFSGFKSRVVLTEDFILIYAGSVGVLKYDRKGQFINKVGRIGQGPGEYDQYSNLVGGDCRDIFFVCTSNNVLYSYDFDGVFLEKTKIEEMPEHAYFDCVYFFNNCFYFFYTVFAEFEKPYLWSIVDREGNVLSSKQDLNFNSSPRTSEWFAFYGNQIVSYNKNSFLYWGNYNDTIFQITKDSIKPFFLWDQGDFRITAEKIQKLSKDFLVPLNIFDLHHYIFFCMKDYNLRKSSFFFYDKQLKTFKGVNHPISDDINGGPPIDHISNYHQVDGNEYLTASIEPYDLKKKLLESNTLKSRKLAETIDEEGNRVLILIWLKK